MNQKSNPPNLINCITGETLTADDLKIPRVVAGVFQQLLNEVWRFAPVDPAHQYQKFLPFDYIWHRISDHLNDPAEIIAHVALGNLLGKVIDYEDPGSMLTLVTEVKPAGHKF